MSAEMFGIWLGVAGFVLSFISAYAQIKGFFVRVFRSGTTAVKRWAEKDRQICEMYLEYPSSLIAYLGRSLALFFVSLFAILVLHPFVPLAAAIHPWLGKLVGLTAPVAAGLVLGGISANCASVIALARSKAGVRK